MASMDSIGFLQSLRAAWKVASWREAAASKGRREAMPVLGFFVGLVAATGLAVLGYFCAPSVGAYADEALGATYPLSLIRIDSKAVSAQSWRVALRAADRNLDTLDLMAESRALSAKSSEDVFFLSEKYALELKDSVDGALVELNQKIRAQESSVVGARDLAAAIAVARAAAEGSDLRAAARKALSSAPVLEPDKAGRAKRDSLDAVSEALRRGERVEATAPMVSASLAPAKLIHPERDAPIDLYIQYRMRFKYLFFGVLACLALAGLSAWALFEIHAARAWTLESFKRHEEEILVEVEKHEIGLSIFTPDKKSKSRRQRL